MARVLGKTDSLHFNVEAYKEESHGGDLKDYRVSVVFTDDNGKKTGNSIKLIATATNAKVAFEMIEAYAQQVQNLSPEQFKQFKDAHKFTFFYAALNRTDDQVSKGADARRVIFYKPHRLRNDLENAFGKKVGDKEIHLTNKILEEIKEYAKMLEGKVEARAAANGGSNPRVGARPNAETLQVELRRRG